MTAATARRASGPWPARLAVALTGLTVAAMAAYVPLALAAHQFTLSGFWAQLVIALPLPAVGLVVARRQPRNPIGWLFVVLSMLLAVGTDAGAYAILVYRLGHHWPLGPVALLAALYWAPLLVSIPVAVPLFPDGHLPSRRWRWALWAYLPVAASWPVSIFAVAAQAMARHATTIVSGGGGDLVAVDFPAGPSAWLGTLETAVLPTLTLFWLAFVVRQVLTWRSADGVRRQQLKWLMSGATVTMAATAFIVVGGSLGPHADRLTQSVLTSVLTVAPLGFTALPLCLGVAILRYRLYDIDRIISRTLGYAIVTGLLVGMYGGVVALTGSLPFSRPAYVAAATLAAAALFNPLRRRVQVVVDRRFNRARYDADRTIAAFATRLSGATDFAASSEDLIQTVRGALEPAHATLWTAGSDW